MIRGLGVGEVSQNRDTVRDDASAKFGAFVSFWLIICSCRPQDGSFMELRHAYLLQVFFFVVLCHSYAFADHMPTARTFVSGSPGASA